jgi:hypothetical protein
MTRTRAQRRGRTAVISSVCMLLAACSPVEITVPPPTSPPEMTHTATAPTISPTSVDTKTPTPEITVNPDSSPTSEVFPTEIYPGPVPRTGAGGVPFEWCPNPAGVEHFAGFPIETAIDLINNLHSGDLQKERQATDPAAWPMLDQYAYGTDQLDASWFDGAIQPGLKSPYAQMLAAQCGQDVINQSWTARICPGPCSANTSESLKADYFFLWRGNALIWMVWP